MAIVLSTDKINLFFNNLHWDNNTVRRFKMIEKRIGIVIINFPSIEILRFGSSRRYTPLLLIFIRHSAAVWSHQMFWCSCRYLPDVFREPQIHLRQYQLSPLIEVAYQLHVSVSQAYSVYSKQFWFQDSFHTVLSTWCFFSLVVFWPISDYLFFF